MTVGQGQCETALSRRRDEDKAEGAGESRTRVDGPKGNYAVFVESKMGK